MCMHAILPHGALHEINIGGVCLWDSHINCFMLLLPQPVCLDRLCDELINWVHSSFKSCYSAKTLL